MGDDYDVKVRQANDAYTALSSEIPELKDLIETNGAIANQLPSLSCLAESLKYLVILYHYQATIHKMDF